MKDNVNHPEHYTQHPSGVECIDITRHYCFSVGNAIKYLWRAGLKKEEGLDDKQKEIEDLNKAIWYIRDRIKQLEMNNVTNKFQKPFKVGDIIQYVDGYKVRITEVNIHDECYSYESIIAKGIGSITFSEQNSWELVPNKFDITTLVPFESRVLVRISENSLWKPAIFGFYNKIDFYTVGSIAWDQCIPYEGNQHLLGTTDDCDEFYKTWE